ARLVESPQQRRERARVEIEALADLVYRGAVVLPQHHEREVLRIGQPEILQHGRVRLDHEAGGGVQRKAELIVESRSGGRRRMSALRARAAWFADGDGGPPDWRMIARGGLFLFSRRAPRA